MSFWNSVYVNKSRKEHFCIYCETNIAKGNSCWHETGIFEGDFNDYYLCGRCKELINSGYPWYENGEGLGTLFDNLVNSDIVICPDCKSYNYSYVEHIFDPEAYVFECKNCKKIYKIYLSSKNLLGNLKNG